MELSNRTLALLLVAAIVISIGGTMVNLNKLNEVTRGGFPLTGYASSNRTGNVTLSVTSQTSIELTVGQIEWGAGYVNGSGACNNCTMGTNNTVDGQCCLGTWGTPIANGLLIENAGNNDVSLAVNFSKNATNFVGGGTTPYFGFKFIAQTTASHPLGDTEGGTDDTESCTGGWNWTTWQNVSNAFNGTLLYACGPESQYNYQHDQNMDEVEMQFRIRIPDDAAIDSKTMNIKFVATSA